MCTHFGHKNAKRKFGRPAALFVLGITAFIAQTPILAVSADTGSTPTLIGRSLPLDEAVRVALQNSKPLQSAAQRVALQNGVVEERRVGFNPSLKNRFSITRYDEGSTANLNGQSITLAKQTQSESYLTAALPLDISGQIANAVSQAQLERLASQLGYNATRNDLVTQVKSDYYAVLRREAYVEVAEGNLTNAEERLRITESKAKSGVVAKFDVTRARTDVASAREALIQATNNVRLSYAQLRRTLGIDQVTPFSAEKVIFEPPAVDEEGTLQKEAASNRPELLAAQVEIQAAERGIKLARRSSDPEVELSIGYAHLPDAGGFSPRTNTWQAGATVRVALFDGGVSKARVHQARQNVELARTSLKNTKEQVSLEAQQAYLSALTAQERIPVAEAALTEAKESYRLAEVRFRTGVSAAPGGSPLLELNDAQTALTRAQTDLVNAQYDLLNARTALDRALGRYGYGEKPGVASPTAVKVKR